MSVHSSEEALGAASQLATDRASAEPAALPLAGGLAPHKTRFTLGAMKFRRRIGPGRKQIGCVYDRAARVDLH
jgi:hypothetical protein